jgi:uncharacterized DUF497 family protein
MPKLVIEELEWDDDNLDHLARHGLRARVVIQVFEEAPKFRRNTGGTHSATHQMIGPDAGGTIWTICLVQNEIHRARWRAISGWNANREERNWYERS